MVPKSKRDYIISQIEQNCPVCHGAGCSTCRGKVARVTMYARSGIPVEYWDRNWKEFDGDPNFKNFVRDNILKRIKDVYHNGESFAFVGNLGLGKSYAACAILKLAIVSDFRAQYQTMSDIINNTLSANIDSNAYLKELMEVDFLAIDEFDVRWIFPSEKSEKMFGSTLEHILRNRFQNRMPTLLCSNTVELDNVLSEDFSKAFESLRNQYIKQVFVSGKDYRKYGKLSR